MAEREKSALYPAVTWNECIDLIQKIDSFKLRAVSYQALAEKYGLTSTTTKSFSARIGAAKQFGLITTAQGSTVQLTDASKRILYPTGDEIRDVELSCFAQPPLYAKLISKYDGAAVPSAALLANILMNEYRITRAVKDNAAKCFIESAEQLNIYRGGVLCYSEAKDKEFPPVEDQKSEPVKETDNTQSEVENVSKGAVPAITASADADYISQSIPFASGKVARFIIPVDATEDDLLLLHDMFAVLLKRKFKIDI